MPSNLTLKRILSNISAMVYRIPLCSNICKSIKQVCINKCIYVYVCVWKAVSAKAAHDDMPNLPQICSVMLTLYKVALARNKYVK